jgi:hypothetical protein
MSKIKILVSLIVTILLLETTYSAVLDKGFNIIPAHGKLPICPKSGCPPTSVILPIKPI